jgi:hypothetical protein
MSAAIAKRKTTKMNKRRKSTAKTKAKAKAWPPSKRSPVTTGASDGSFTVGPVVKGGTLDLLREKGRNSKYQAIRDGMARLKPGEVLPLTPPQGLKAGQFLDRLSANITNTSVIAPSGYRFYKRQTVDGKVAIGLAALCD